MKEKESQNPLFINRDNSEANFFPLLYPKSSKYVTNVVSY